MKEFFLKMFTAHSGLSSKRVLCVYCTIMVIPAPEVVELLFICSTSLLGIDSITGIWHKNINK